MNESEDYTIEDIIDIISRGQLIRADFYTLAPDHFLRIYLYDIEKAAETITNPKFKQIFTSLQNRKTINQIANEQDTSERNIYRNIKQIKKILVEELNGDQK